MKVTDYIAKVLSERGIKVVFGVTGGAVVHLFDSAQKMGMECLFTHHEQTAAFAAGAYARVEGIGALFCTTGPGGTNTITGVSAAWLDSVPVICIGGQVRLSHMKPESIRQQGAQELDMVSLMKPITKFSHTLQDVKALPEILQTCIEIATTGRPGPVYVEIPLDFQWQTLSLSEEKPEKVVPSFLQDLEKAKDVCARFNKAKRPLVLVGHGVRLAKAKESLRDFLEKSQVPHISTWNAIDLVEGYSPLYLGCPGMFGTREANLAVQACDFLLCIGSHLPIPVTTGLYDKFAGQAEVAVVNIDQAELLSQRVRVAHKIQMDAHHFLQEASLLAVPLQNRLWKQSCSFIRKLFSTESYKKESQKIDAYQAVKKINEMLSEEDIVVVDGGGTVVQVSFQTLKATKNQRLLIDAGLCSMGSGLPQAIGACKARKKARVFCLVGDGSFMFNMQELQTVLEHKLNVTIVIFNNDGYLSIRNTQKSFLEGNYLGSSKEGGISLPSFEKIAKAFNIPYFQAENEELFCQEIEKAKQIQGPKIYELYISEKQEIYPRIGFSKNPNGFSSQNPIDKMDPPAFEKEVEAFLQEVLSH